MMRISLFTIVAAVLALAVLHAPLQAADVANLPLAADTAMGNNGPQPDLAVADEVKAPHPPAPVAPAPPTAVPVESGASAPVTSAPSAPVAPAPVESTQSSEAAAAAPAAAEAVPPPDAMWHLPEPEMLKKLGIVQYGWLEQGVTFNSLSPVNRWNGPVFTNDRSNEYEMNQLWLGWEKAVKQSDCGGWDIGGRVDLMYGSDWRYGECYGLETNLDSPNHLYGLILPQFYMEVGYNNLSVKMGHFAPSIGYEVVAAPGNFFYSHSYALGYSEPVLVTGLQADYRIGDHWNVIGGFNNGFNQFVDQNGMLHFLGGAKWHNDEHKVSLSWMIDAGPQDPLGQNNQYVSSLVFKKQFNEKLSYAFEQTFGGTEMIDNPDPAKFGPYAKWYGLDQYLLYTINQCWSAGARAEVFRDQDGTRVGGLGSVGLPGWPAAGGFAGTFTEVTLGLNWHPNANIVIRPEARWDCYSGSTNVQGQEPFGDGTRTSQFLFATDLIFSF